MAKLHLSFNKIQVNFHARAVTILYHVYLYPLLLCDDNGYQVLAVAISLPFWMLLRSIVRAVGSVVPALARAMARALPVK